MASETQTLAATRRVLIVEDNSLVAMGLRTQLEKLGHTVIGEANSAAEAAALYMAHTPDLVLMDIRFEGDPNNIDGIELARQLLMQRRSAIVIISAFSEKGLIDRAAEAGVFGYLIKPITPEALQAQIEIACGRFAEHERVIADKDALAAQLATRKLVERAKGIFMRRHCLDEEDAHKKLQIESQKRRISLADIARKVIESEELLDN